MFLEVHFKKFIKDFGEGGWGCTKKKSERRIHSTKNADDRMCGERRPQFRFTTSIAGLKDKLLYNTQTFLAILLGKTILQTIFRFFFLRYIQGVLRSSGSGLLVEAKHNFRRKPAAATCLKLNETMAEKKIS